MPAQQQEVLMKQSVEKPQGNLEQVRLRARMRQLEADQNPVLGVVAGMTAAAAGAVVWAMVTVATNHQIGWMAVGVGFLVGYAVRLLGKGITPLFGVIGASLSVLGCLGGNLLSTCMLIAKKESLPLSAVLGQLNPELVVTLLAETFNPIDLLFYGIAMYVAYQYSFRPVAEEVPTQPEQ